MSTTAGNDKKGSWIDAIENPLAIGSIYSEEPQVVELFSIHLDREGPKAELKCLLDRFPDKPPQKWVAARSNRVLVTIRVDGVSQIRISGWATTNEGRLTFETISRRNIHFLFQRNTGDAIVEGVAMFADIVGFSHYMEGAPPPSEPDRG